MHSTAPASPVSNRVSRTRLGSHQADPPLLTHPLTSISRHTLGVGKGFHLPLSLVEEVFSLLGASHRQVQQKSNQAASALGAERLRSSNTLCA